MAVFWKTPSIILTKNTEIEVIWSPLTVNSPKGPDGAYTCYLRAQRFSHYLQGEDYESMKAYLEQDNAFKDNGGSILRFNGGFYKSAW